MKFLIISRNGSKIIEAEDFEKAVYQACDDHTGYDYVWAIVKLPEET